MAERPLYILVAADSGRETRRDSTIDVGFLIWAIVTTYLFNKSLFYGCVCVIQRRLEANREVANDDLESTVSRFCNSFRQSFLRGGQALYFGDSYGIDGSENKNHRGLWLQRWKESVTKRTIFFSNTSRSWKICLSFQQRNRGRQFRWRLVRVRVVPMRAMEMANPTSEIEQLSLELFRSVFRSKGIIRLALYIDAWKDRFLRSTREGGSFSKRRVLY